MGHVHTAFNHDLKAAVGKFIGFLVAFMMCTEFVQFVTDGHFQLNFKI